MRKLWTCSLLFALGCVAAHGAPANQAETESATLRQMTQALLDAVAPGDKAVWERILDVNVVHMDEEGEVRGKAALLETLTPLPAGIVGHIQVDKFNAHLQGDLAVVAHEDQEDLDYFGQKLHGRFRSLDTWQRTGGQWRLIAVHVEAVLKDPPSISLSHAAICAYAGRYALTETMVQTITCDGTSLRAKRDGRPDTSYEVEVADVFFVKDRPRTRRIFQRDERGRVVAFVDRREGEDVRWRRLEK